MMYNFDTSWHTNDSNVYNPLEKDGWKDDHVTLINENPMKDITWIENSLAFKLVNKRT